MSKLEKVFDTPNKKAFIGFLTAGDPDADSTVQFILEMEKAGADLILIETMSDTYELKAAVLAAKENSTLPIMATVIFDESKKMLTGASPQAPTQRQESKEKRPSGVHSPLVIPRSSSNLLKIAPEPFT